MRFAASFFNEKQITAYNSLSVHLGSLGEHLSNFYLIGFEA